jgi:hypothetical protein
MTVLLPMADLPLADPAALAAATNYSTSRPA